MNRNSKWKWTSAVVAFGVLGFLVGSPLAPLLADEDRRSQPLEQEEQPQPPPEMDQRSRGQQSPSPSLSPSLSPRRPMDVSSYQRRQERARPSDGQVGDNRFNNEQFNGERINNERFNGDRFQTDSFRDEDGGRDGRSDKVRRNQGRPSLGPHAEHRPQEHRPQELRPQELRPIDPSRRDQPRDPQHWGEHTHVEPSRAPDFETDSIGRQHRELELRIETIELEMNARKLQLAMMELENQPVVASLDAMDFAVEHLSPSDAIEVLTSSLQDIDEPAVRNVARRRLIEMHLKLDQREPAMDLLRTIITTK
ncbi:hypothetical protein N9N28_01065 [Rubripirellula amarantea]|nr:hypothetical protein [Rubripirellula amarantea]